MNAYSYIKPPYLGIGLTRKPSPVPSLSKQQRAKRNSRAKGAGTRMAMAFAKKVWT